MTEERVILGENCIYSADPQKTGLNNNVVVCGSTGSGKTKSITEPRLLETKESSLVVTVTKRRVVDMYKKLFQDRGYEVLDLDFTDPEGSRCVYDPMAFVKTEADITHLAKAIVETGDGNGSYRYDPYWDKAATSMLSALISYVKEACPPYSTFVDVVKLLRFMEISYRHNSEKIKTTLDPLFNELSGKNGRSFAVNCWNSFLTLPMRTASCVAGTVDANIDNMFTPEICRMVSRGNNIDIRKLGSRKTILFITSSPVNTAANKLVGVFYSHIFKGLFEYAEKLPEGRLAVPLHMVCDDFATGGRVENFAEYISIFREKGISVTLLLQSESQLKGMYGDRDATTIINNCDSYVYLGGMDVDTVQSISRRANKPFEDIMCLKPCREVVLRRGARAVITDRYHIYENELYRKVENDYNEARKRRVEETGNYMERREAFRRKTAGTRCGEGAA